MDSMKIADDPATASSAHDGQDSRQIEPPALLSKSDLYELRELIGTIWTAGFSPSPDVDQIVASANRVGSGFTARLAIRSLRLEQALIEAQEKIIRLEWRLAQINKNRY